MEVSSAKKNEFSEIWGDLENGIVLGDKSSFRNKKLVGSETKKMVVLRFVGAKIVENNLK